MNLSDPFAMMGKRYNDMDIGIFWPAKSLRPLICKRWRYHDVFAAHKMNLRQFDKFFGPSISSMSAP